MKYLRILLMSLIFVCLVIFCVNNRNIVTVDFFPLGFVVETRMFLLLFLVFFLGIVFGKYLNFQRLLGNTWQRLHQPKPQNSTEVAISTTLPAKTSK